VGGGRLGLQRARVERKKRRAVVDDRGHASRRPPRLRLALRHAQHGCEQDVIGLACFTLLLLFHSTIFLSTFADYPVAIFA
jgi:hypothetical protein